MTEAELIYHRRRPFPVTESVSDDGHRTLRICDPLSGIALTAACEDPAARDTTEAVLRQVFKGHWLDEYARLVSSNRR